jgi:hypothetical protein
VKAGRALAIALLLGLGSATADAGGPPSPIDPGARLPRGDEASEHWDLAAHFDSGHRVYARFLITNEGPGERTAVAFGHVLKPDGTPVAFKNGRREGRWQLGDGGRRIEIGSSLLDFGDDVRRFEVDNDKRGIKVHFEVPADAPGLSAPPGPGGTRLELLNLASVARGRLWLRGMAAPVALNGRALLTHSWSVVHESEAIARRADFATLAGDDAFFFSHARAPDGTPWAWAVSGAASGRLISHTDVRVEARPADNESGPYPLPDSIQLRGKGLDASISLEAPPVLVSDPLDALPSLLKMVYSFGGRPRHLWADAVADVALEPRNADPSRRIQSAGIAAFYFSDGTP